MTGLFSIPKRNTESLRGSGDTPLGAGQWVGTIEDIFVKDELPSDKDGKMFAGYASSDGQEISLQLGALHALDGQDDVGNKKFFVRIVTRDGDLDLSSVDPTTRGAAHWQLQRSVARAANLAVSLGYTDEDGDNVVVRGDFIDALIDGTFKDTKVGFVIYHRKGKAKTDTTGAKTIPIYDEIDTFFAYVD